ncbi:helix-turn-helix domain-containing protein [Mycobacteroides abscessus]|uniref:helix-turn-helix domain-containing protein n=1 Tax=Mycobacteroides abscessus TaxID=36809 RepID=UPI001E55BAFC|nr:helix-turn-helix domain-containing protein [Mycobacteroides abscessus]MDO3096798.1 helix-turn-helix domain-containing protein [Mycobacteroides abscessus subsp. abscessus]
MTTKGVPTPLGVRVRTLRKQRGWSAQKLSDETGGSVTRCVIADLELGRKKDLSLTAGAAIASAFGMSVDQLIYYAVPAGAYAAAREIVDAKLRLESILALKAVAVWPKEPWPEPDQDSSTSTTE